MTILPIKLITDEEQPLFGSSLTLLGKLKRANLPVLNGYGVSAPQLMLETFLSHYQNHSKEVFEQSLGIIKADLKKIAPPEEIVKFFSKGSFYYQGNYIKGVRVLWLQLLEFWISEIRAKVWQSGFSPELTKNLTAQIVYEAKGKKLQVIESFYDPDFKEVVIENSASDKKLSDLGLKTVQETVVQANKILTLPQVYTLGVTPDRVYILDLKPYTHPVLASEKKQLILPQKEIKTVTKSAVKVFLNLSSGLATTTHLDGILIESGYQFDFDALAFKLAESALSYPDKPVIFKLPDDKTDSPRGALRLISQASLLNQAAEVFSYARYKKGLSNVQICLPYLRSSTELLHLKRELASLGITRKGSLKLWLEFAVPENFINLDSYLLAGFDGVLIDFDSLAYHLGGFDPGVEENYKSEFMAVIRFLTPFIKELHKNKLPILGKGMDLLNSTLLDFILEMGIWGIVSNNLIEAESLPDHLNWSEKRFIHKLPRT